MSRDQYIYFCLAVEHGLVAWGTVRDALALVDIRAGVYRGWRITRFTRQEPGSRITHKNWQHPFLILSLLSLFGFALAEA